MQFKRSFVVEAPVQAVERFHRRPQSLKRLTPPPLRVADIRSAENLDQGDSISFRLFFGPFSVPWEAFIEELSPQGFVDRQIQGPFQNWVHRHRYRVISQECTEITDQIDWTYKNHLGWLLLGLVMTLSLPFLFAFRAWSTKQHLKREK